MNLVSRVALIAVLAIFCGVARAQVQQDTCDQCKYLRCLKSTVERKQKLIDVYQGLHNFWRPRTLDEKSVPLMVKDLGALAEPERSRIYRALLQQHDQYTKMADSRTDAVPKPEGCGYGDEEKLAKTDSFASCATEGLAEAKAGQPCKELAQLIEAHEGLHVKACQARRGRATEYWPYVYKDETGQPAKRYLPPRMLTPAGLALEEISAYQLEIKAIQKLVDELEKKCRKVSFTNVTLDCTMGQGTLRTGQILEGRACGDPTKATWEIRQINFMEGTGMPRMIQGTDTFKTDCPEAGSSVAKHYADVYRRSGPNSGGWTCVYDKAKPQVTIRNFRLAQCEGPREQTVTVEAVLGEKCDEPERSPRDPREPVS